MQRHTTTRAASVLLAGSLLLGAAGATSAQAEDINMRFDVNIGGMKAMKLSFSGNVGRTTYTASAELKPRGFAKLFIKKSYNLSVKGRFNDNYAHPQQFTMAIRKKSKTRTATVRWPGGKPVWQRTPPQSEGRRREIAGALKGRVLDPLSMLLQFARARNAGFCEGRVRIFDGHDVYDILARKLGTKAVRTRIYSGPALVCRLKYVPVAGLSEKKKRRRLADPPVYTTWLARVRSSDSGTLHVPVRVEGRFDGRPFTAVPTMASLGGKPLQPAGN